MSKKDKRYGWICPRCQKVNAPHVDSCACSILIPNTAYPYPWYPVYPWWEWRPYGTWTTCTSETTTDSTATVWIDCSDTSVRYVLEGE